jgi:hypothetical protein
MFSLASGNMTTALVVAGNVEFLPAIAAMLLRVAPAVIFPLVIYALYRLREFHTDDEDGQIVVVLSVLVLLAAVFYSSLLGLGTCMVMFVLHRIHLRSHKKNWKRKANWARFDPELARQVMVSLIITAVAWGPSWLARETATIKEEQHVISVIKETDEFLYYLDRKSNRVVYARPSDISQRALCGTGDYDTVNALIQLITSGPTYPTCPNTKDL